MNNTFEHRKFPRHPVEVPIEVRKVDAVEFIRKIP